jgi:hypothetical protein
MYHIVLRQEELNNIFLFISPGPDESFRLTGYAVQFKHNNISPCFYCPRVEDKNFKKFKIRSIFLKRLILIRNRYALIIVDLLH